MIFIDIGAFDGDSTKEAIARGYEVYAFEPNPDTLNQYGVDIIRAAAWNEDGVARLYQRNERDTNNMSCSIIRSKTNIDPSNFQEVKTINFGKWLKELDKDIDVLKIDAEGAEYYIIESVLDNFDPERIKEWKVEDHSGFILEHTWREHRQNILDRLKKLNIDLKSW